MVDKRSGGDHKDASAEQDSDEADSEFEEVDPKGRYGRYKEVLGKGAFKTVYRAFDELEGMEVAWNQVKVQDVLQRAEDLERLYSEVHLLKTLKHKNIIKFYNSWVDTKTDNINFITEIFTSGTLRQYRRKHKHVDMRAVKNWSRQILRGLLYLHSHDPPIIHRDLKCDNIFVNGNQGEVKIGDLGLAAILRQAHAAHSVIGTPEFMAPELYEEEYNELVDIYAFGMCLLEMVTFEYPYSECANAAQIYKKVTSGKKPAALDKVKDPEVREFVEKCLATASRRLPARELLMDPFLQCDGGESIDHVPRPTSLSMFGDGPKDLSTIVEEPSQSSKPLEANCVPKLADMGILKRAKDLTLQVHSNALAVSCLHSESAGGDNYQHPESYSEGEGSPSPARVNRGFTVKGQRTDDNTVFLRLRIADSEGHVRNIHFPFDIDADTAMSVASEMVTELDLSDQDVTNIAAMIDAEIQALVPEWRPVVAFVDTAEEEMYSDYPGSAIDDDVSEMLSDNDSPPGAFVLERLPSGRKYWSDSPRSLTPDSYMKTALMNASSKAEGLMPGRFDEVNHVQSSSSNVGHQHNEFNDHKNKGADLDSSSKFPRSLGRGNLQENAVLIDKEKNHSLSEVIKNTVVAEVKMSTEDMNTNCKTQKGFERMSQENLQIEDCKIDTALDQNVVAGKPDGKTLSPEAGVTLPDSTDSLADEVEDENSIAQKIKLLILKQQEEIDELRQKHERILRDFINQLPQKGFTVKFLRNGLLSSSNDTCYKVSADSSVSKIKPFHGADLVSSKEESDETSNQKASVEEFGNLTSVVRKETVQGAPYKDIGIETASKESTSGLAAKDEQTVKHNAHPLDKKVVTKETENPCSLKCTEPLEISCFAVSASKMETGCNQADTSTVDKCLRQDVTGAQFKMSNNVKKFPISKCSSVSNSIDKLGKRGSFIELYKDTSSLRDKSTSSRGEVKSLDMDTKWDLSRSSDKSKNDDKELYQLKKEQLQKSIADLEARTLEGLKQSKSGYLINNSGKKLSAGVSQAGAVGSNVSATRQQASSEVTRV